MRHLSTVVLFLTACGSTSGSGGGGGGVSLSFGDAGARAVVFTTTPAGAAMIHGEFSASGDFEGQYTLSTSVPSGSAVATCLLSVDGGMPGASVKVDATSSAMHSLTVEIGLASDYQGQAVCNVEATNNAKPNVGNEVTISVTGPSGAAG